MKIIQVNLNRCRRAHDLLYNVSLELGLDLCLVSEPNLELSQDWGGNEDAKIWRTTKNTYAAETGNIKGCTWMKTNNLLIISIYTSGNDPIHDLQGLLREISGLIRSTGMEAIIAGDFNAHSPMWGETRTNARGQIVSDWIASENLIVCNTGQTPTFRARGTESIIDLTLCTEGTYEKITNWKVIDDMENNSDHNYIYFEVDRGRNETANDADRRSFRWKINTLDREKVKDILKKYEEENPEGNENEKNLTDLAKEICNTAMKKRKNNARAEAHWWNRDIESKRKICIQKRRIYTRNKRFGGSIEERTYEEYRMARTNMNIEIGKAKKKCWNEICEELNRDIWGLGYKIVAGKLRKGAPKIPAETRKQALDTLFPVHPPALWRRSPVEIPEDLLIRVDELVEATSKMKNKKAPGPDGIPAAVIKTMVMESPNLFLRVLNNLAKKNEFPNIWKEATVVLLEKPKKQNTDPTTYRPICLLNTLGKLFESIVNMRLCAELEERGLLSPRQYGFRKGKSTLHAVQQVLNIAKEEMSKPYRRRGLCLMITIDIKNAFNSVSWTKVVEEMEKMSISKYLIEILKSYLSQRVIVGETFNKEMTAGVPQGSLIGPTLWNLVYNSILDIDTPEDTTLIAYADDLAIVIRAGKEEELERKAENVLNQIECWMAEKQLQIAPEKSEMILLIGRKRCKPLNIKLGNCRLEEKPTLKYLGIILDRHLKFGPHLQYVTEKATKVTNALTRIMPRTGGPGEAKRRVLHSAAESVMLYGAPVWVECLKIKKRRKFLIKAQRKGILRVSCGYRTISNEAAAVIASVIPADLLAEERAATYMKPSEIKKRERENTINKWQTRWESATKGAWTRKLIPDIKVWMDRKHGELNYYLTQAITGHGCFRQYLHRFKLANAECATCWFCDAEDTAEHTLFACRRWERERSLLEEDLQTTINTENLVQTMIHSEENWDKINSFITQIMKDKIAHEKSLQSTSS